MQGERGDGARSPWAVEATLPSLTHRRVTSVLRINTKLADGVREKLVFTLHLKAVSPEWLLPEEGGDTVRVPVGLAQDRGVRVEETPADGRTLWTHTLGTPDA